jgi:hypothetical protein
MCKKQNDRRRNDPRTCVTQTTESMFGDNILEVQQEQGENLMSRRVLLKLEKKISEEKEPYQKKAIFKTKCKIEGKCSNLIID